MVANAATLVAKVIGKAVRDEKPCYYIDDGVYHTFSGVSSVNRLLRKETCSLSL